MLWGFFWVLFQLIWWVVELVIVGSGEVVRVGG